jgi:hypothetical protein
MINTYQHPNAQSAMGGLPKQALQEMSSTQQAGLVAGIYYPGITQQNQPSSSGLTVEIARLEGIVSHYEKAIAELSSKLNPLIPDVPQEAHYNQTEPARTPSQSPLVRHMQELNGRLATSLELIAYLTGRIDL